MPVVALLGGCQLIINHDTFKPASDAADAPITDAQGDAPNDVPPADAPPMFRFWRVEVVSHDTSAGGGSVVLTEIQVRIDGVIHDLSMATLTTPDPMSLVNAHPALTALTDGQLTTSGADNYVSVGDGATIDIDLGSTQALTSILIAPSGFNDGAPTNAPLEWTLGQFQFCSSATEGPPYACAQLDGGGRAGWTNATLREFIL